MLTGAAALLTAVATCLAGQSAESTKKVEAVKTMADGRQWTTVNLNVKTASSYCYSDLEDNCRKFGRLYTWESARQACPLLGKGWRLPTNEEWRQLAMQYGGLIQDSAAGGRATFAALMTGGSAGFSAVFGGGRTLEATYARGNQHGFYWTATESGKDTAWFYNFGDGMKALNRHDSGEKGRAFAVRCIRE